MGPCTSPPNSHLRSSALLEQRRREDGADQSSQGLEPGTGWSFPSPYHTSHNPSTILQSPESPPQHHLIPLLCPRWPLLMAPSCCQAVAVYFQALLVPGAGECEERSPVHPVCSWLRIDLAWPGPTSTEGLWGVGIPSHLPVGDNGSKKLKKKWVSLMPKASLCW